MQFTQIPQQYAPLGGELRYAVGQAAAGNIDIRIVEAAAEARAVALPTTQAGVGTSGMAGQTDGRSVTEVPCWAQSGSQR